MKEEEAQDTGHPNTAWGSMWHRVSSRKIKNISGRANWKWVLSQFPSSDHTWYGVRSWVLSRGDWHVKCEVLQSYCVLAPAGVFPGLDSGTCFSSPVRPLRLVACVVSMAMLPELRAKRAIAIDTTHASYVPVLSVTVPASCMHGHYVRYVYYI
jgi:hypothetical protein